MVTALPYLLLVVIYGLLAVYQYTKDDEKTRFYVNVFSVGVFLLFFGLRGFIFYDWVNYYPTFQATPDLKTQLTIPLLKWEAEYGFTLLMIFCRSIYPNWHFFVFVCTLINVILLLNFLKSRVENIPFVLVLFVRTMTTIQKDSVFNMNPNLAVDSALTYMLMVRERKHK